MPDVFEFEWWLTNQPALKAQGESSDFDGETK